MGGSPEYKLEKEKSPLFVRSQPLEWLSKIDWKNWENRIYSYSVKTIWKTGTILIYKNGHTIHSQSAKHMHMVYIPDLLTKQWLRQLSQTPTLSDF